MDEHDTAAARPPRLADPVEAEAARLRERYPGWRVWGIRNAVTKTVTWYAEPTRYPVAGWGPEELAAAIEADDRYALPGTAEDDPR